MVYQEIYKVLCGNVQISKFFYLDLFQSIIQEFLDTGRRVVDFCAIYLRTFKFIFFVSIKL